MESLENRSVGMANLKNQQTYFHDVVMPEARASTITAKEFASIKDRQEMRREIDPTPEQLEELMADMDTLLRLFDAASN
jgi:hypothetical protein